MMSSIVTKSILALVSLLKMSRFVAEGQYKLFLCLSPDELRLSLYSFVSEGP